jgi:predicted alpha/beta hydrolase family esterase
MEEAENIASRLNASFTVIHNAGHINADSGYGKWELIEKLVLQEE